MKLGIILPPEAASLERAKSLGLDFVEFDCNPLGYGGQPKADQKGGHQGSQSKHRRGSGRRRTLGQPHFG